MSLLSILCSMIGRNDEENMYAGIVPFWMIIEKDLVASSWTWRGAMYRYSCKSMVNPLHLNISMKILHTVLLPFLCGTAKEKLFNDHKLHQLTCDLNVSFSFGFLSLLGVKGLVCFLKVRICYRFCGCNRSKWTTKWTTKWCEKYGSLSLFLWYNTYEYVWFSQIQFWKKLGSVFQIYIFDIRVSSI